MIVTVKSSGCLQIGFWPQIIDYICNFLVDPRTLVNQILNDTQVCLFRSQVCPYQLEILVDFIEHLNVFSLIFLPLNLINWSKEGQIQKLQI